MKKRTFNILLIGACAACIGTAAVGFGACKDSAASAKTEISNKAPVLPEKEENITKINDNDLLNMVKQESGNTASGAEAGAEAGNAGNSAGNSGAETGETVSGANTSDLENTIKNYAGDLFAIGQSAEMALTDNDATSGITFTAKINAYYDTAAYGMFVVPYTLVKKLPAGTDYITNIYSRLPEAAKQQITLPYNTCIPYEMNESNYISVSLVDIKGANFDLDYVAIPYVEFKEEEKVTRYYTAAVENNAACVSEVLADTYGKLAETEKTYAERMATRAVTCFKGTEGALDVVTSDGEPLNNTTVYKSAAGLTVKEHDGVPVKFSTESEAIEIDEKTGVVTIKNSAKSVTINAAFCQYTASATFDIAGKRLVIQNTALNLLENKTVDGTVNTKNVNATVAATYKGEDNEDLGLATGVQLKSNNETVAKVNDGGIIEAVSSGETVITATAPDATNTVDISVTVWVGIATPADMDALSLITYYNDKTTAQTLLSKNYLLMNDIDYSTHVRNFILPIASLKGNTDNGSDHTDVFGLVNETIWARQASGWGWGGPGGWYASYYSESWKAILNLTEAGDGTNGYYLQNEADEEFLGINPNAVRFSGVLNGNGYAIKNAFLMADNFLTEMPSNIDGSYQGGHWGFAMGVIGLNQGIISNVSFENIMMPNASVYVTRNGAEIKYSYTSGPVRLHYEQVAEGKAIKFSKVRNSETATYCAAYGITSSAIYASALSSVIVLNLGTVENVAMTYTSMSLDPWRSACGDIVDIGPFNGNGLVFNNRGNIGNVVVARTETTGVTSFKNRNGNTTYTAENWGTTQLIAAVQNGDGSIEKAEAWNETASKLSDGTYAKVRGPFQKNTVLENVVTELNEQPVLENGKCGSYVSLTHLI